MIVVRGLAADEHAAWDQYVLAHPAGSAWHRAGWAATIGSLFGHQPHYLGAWSAAGTLCGVLPLIRMRSALFGHFLVSMPYFNYGGVLAEDAASRDALLQAAAALGQSSGAAYAELRHTGPQGSDWPAREHKVSMWLALPASADELWSALPAKLRSQVRRPSKAGATAIVGGAELLDDFYAVFSRNMRDLGTPVYPRRFFAAVLKQLPDSRVVVVRLEGQPVAAGVLCSHGQRLEIPWASSVREANRHSVNMLLYWESLQYAISSGHQQFDFGRSTPGEGTWRFKRQWGAEEVPLRWEYWLRDGQQLPSLNPANPKYQLAIRLWQRLPLWLANWLGPLLVKNIP